MTHFHELVAVDTYRSHAVTMSVIEPTIRLRSLGLALRRHREAIGLTPEEAAALLVRSASSVLRIEKGLHHTPVRDVEYFLLKYGVIDPAEHKRLYDLSRNGRKKGWWQSYKDLLSPGDMDLFSIEEDAETLENFELILIPGLLQIEDYAREVISTGRAAKDPQRIARLVEVRMRRQRILTQPNAPKLWAIVCEAALRQMVGGPAVMQAQWQHLLAVTERSNITMQVLPYCAGAFVGMSGASLLISLGDPVGLEVVVVSSLTKTSYLEDETETRRHAESFNQMRAAALTESESREMIQGLLSEL